MEEFNQNNKFFKICLQNKQVYDQHKLHIICIYDSSGSMDPYWEWLAKFHNANIPQQNNYVITFDTKQYCSSNAKLHEQLFKHGGGGTAIPEAFQAFEEHLKSVSLSQQVTVIFISDGQDNNMNTLEERMTTLKGNINQRQLNFICVGIGKNFPHFLSMRLRQLYHVGDDSIPALYLIEYPSQKAFFNKFEGIKKYFQYQKQVKIDPPVQLCPWDESVIDLVYEGQWVILKQYQGIKIDGQLINLNNNRKFGLQEADDIFKGWIQQLQMIQLKSKNQQQIKDYFRSCLLEMEMIISRINYQLKINVRKLDEKMRTSAVFSERAKANYVVRYGQKINWYFSEVEAMLLGQKLQEEDEFEAAKKMNIGTLSGVYFQKQLALQVIKEDVFRTYKEEFTQQYLILYEKLKNQQNKNNLHSLKKLFLQPNFIESFNEFVTNQFDLVELFEFSGNACKIRKSELTDQKPWQFEIKSISFEEMNNIQLSNMQVWGIKQKFSSILGPEIDYGNFFIPLIDPEDSDLSDILNTRIMKFLISWTITNNFDVIYDDAYLYMIGNLLQFLIKQQNLNQNQNWIKKQLIQRCITSLQIFYGQNGEFQEFQQNLPNYISNPSNLEDIDNEPLNKFLIHYFYRVLFQQQNQQQVQQNQQQLQQQIEDEKNNLEINQFQIMSEQLIIRYLKYHIDQLGLLALVKPDLSDIDIQIFSQQIGTILQDKMSSFYTTSDLKDEIQKQFVTVIGNNNITPKINKDRLNEQTFILNLQALESFNKEILNINFEDKFYSSLLCHVHDPNASQQQQQQQQQYEEEEKKQSDNQKLQKAVFSKSQKNYQSHNEILEAYTKCLQIPVNYDQIHITKCILSQINLNNCSNLPGFQYIYQNLEDIYLSEFVKRHYDTMSMSEYQVRQFALQHNVHFKLKSFKLGYNMQQKNLEFYFDISSFEAKETEFEYNPNSGLCTNACMSPNCKFFMIPKNEVEFQRHMMNWKTKMPSGFHKLVKSIATFSVDYIFKRAKEVYVDFPDKYGLNQEQTKIYITKILNKQ